MLHPWTGNWKAVFTNEANGVRIQAGMQETKISLHAEEQMRTPMVMLQFFKGDQDAGHNAFRQLVLKSYTPSDASGEPIKKAMMSIGGIKGVEIGDGFEVACKKGSENNDAMRENGFVSNHAGGITGGISNGNTIIIRCAVKPTPSIAQIQQTVNLENKNTDIEIHGRHDPCLVPRIVPVVEAMCAMVIADMLRISGLATDRI